MLPPFAQHEPLAPAPDVAQPLPRHPRAQTQVTCISPLRCGRHALVTRPSSCRPLICAPPAAHAETARTALLGHVECWGPGHNQSTVALDGTGPAHTTSVCRHHGSPGNQPALRAGRHAGPTGTRRSDLPRGQSSTHGTGPHRGHRLPGSGRRCGKYLVTGTPTVSHPYRRQG